MSTSDDILKKYGVQRSEYGASTTTSSISNPVNSSTSEDILNKYGAVRSKYGAVSNALQGEQEVESKIKPNKIVQDLKGFESDVKQEVGGSQGLENNSKTNENLGNYYSNRSKAGEENSGFGTSIDLNKVKESGKSDTTAEQTILAAKARGNVFEDTPTAYETNGFDVNPEVYENNVYEDTRTDKAIKAGYYNIKSNLQNLVGLAQESADRQVNRFEDTPTDSSTGVYDSVIPEQRQLTDEEKAYNKQKAQEYYTKSDENTAKYNELMTEATEGRGKVGKFIMNLVPSAESIAFEVAASAVIPGSGLAIRAANAAGELSKDYRLSTGDSYDPNSAEFLAIGSVVGNYAGAALSHQVSKKGLDLLKVLNNVKLNDKYIARGIINSRLANSLLSSASGVSYSATNIGAQEIAKYLVYDNYTPNWKGIGGQLLESAIFSGLVEYVASIKTSAQNKAQMQKTLSSFEEKYNKFKTNETARINNGGTKDLAGARKLKYGAERFKEELNNTRILGANEEVTKINEFMDSIIDEMDYYIGYNSGLGSGIAQISGTAQSGNINPTPTAPTSTSTVVNEEPTSVSNEVNNTTSNNLDIYKFTGIKEGSEDATTKIKETVINRANNAIEIVNQGDISESNGLKLKAIKRLIDSALASDIIDNDTKYTLAEQYNTISEAIGSQDWVNPEMYKTTDNTVEPVVKKFDADTYAKNNGMENWRELAKQYLGGYTIHDYENEESFKNLLDRISDSQFAESNNFDVDKFAEEYGIPNWRVLADVYNVKYTDADIADEESFKDLATRIEQFANSPTKEEQYEEENKTSDFVTLVKPVAKEHNGSYYLDNDTLVNDDLFAESVGIATHNVIRVKGPNKIDLIELDDTSKDNPEVKNVITVVIDENGEPSYTNTTKNFKATVGDTLVNKETLEFGKTEQLLDLYNSNNVTSGKYTFNVSKNRNSGYTLKVNEEGVISTLVSLENKFATKESVIAKAKSILKQFEDIDNSNNTDFYKRIAKDLLYKDQTSYGDYGLGIKKSDYGKKYEAVITDRYWYFGMKPKKGKVGYFLDEFVDSREEAYNKITDYVSKLENEFYSIEETEQNNTEQAETKEVQIDNTSKESEVDSIKDKFVFDKDVVYKDNPEWLLERVKYDPNKQNDIAERNRVKQELKVTMEDIDRVLLGGSNFENGKRRIYDFFNENHTQAERIDFLKKEYGIGGSSGRGTSYYYDGKGMSFENELIAGPKKEDARLLDIIRGDKLFMNWNNIAKRIEDLIDDGKYISATHENKSKESEIVQKESENISKEPEKTIEEAKQELKKAITIGQETNNFDALMYAIETKQLSMDVVELKGSVDGFSNQQRMALAKNLIENVGSDTKTIKTDVPYDGTFEINNDANSVCKILDGLKVKVRQNALINNKLASWMKSAQRLGGLYSDTEYYLTDGNIMLNVPKETYDFVIDNKSKFEVKNGSTKIDNQLPISLTGEFTDIITQPTESISTKGTKVYTFNNDINSTFSKKYIDTVAKMFDYATLQLSTQTVNGRKSIRAIGLNDEVLALVMPIRVEELTETKPATISLLKPEKIKEIKKLKGESVKNQQNNPKVNSESNNADKTNEKNAVESTTETIQVKRHGKVVLTIPKTGKSTVVHENEFEPDGLYQRYKKYDIGPDTELGKIISTSPFKDYDTVDVVINSKKEEYDGDDDGGGFGYNGNIYLKKSGKYDDSVIYQGTKSIDKEFIWKELLNYEALDKEFVNESPQLRLADMVEREIPQGFKAEKLFELADEAFGGTMADGTYTVKDAYDGMELAVNKMLIDSSIVRKSNQSDLKVVNSTLEYLGDILSKLPTETKRTDEQVKYQQFSTPPTIAYLASWMADINNKDVVVEPSAGIGGIALFPKAWGAEVYANEYSPRRLQFLNELGLDGTFQYNAEYLDSVLPYDIKPSVIVMNPPFSATAGRMENNNTKYAKAHVEQALARLENGGRLVAILGRGMEDGAPSFRSWWNELKEKYNVRANVRIDGSNYTKYGTNFDIQLVVIDKNGKTETPTFTGSYMDLIEAANDLRSIRDDRQYIDSKAKSNTTVKGVQTDVQGQNGNGPLSDNSSTRSTGEKPVSSSGTDTDVSGDGRNEISVSSNTESSESLPVNDGKQSSGSVRTGTGNGTAINKGAQREAGVSSEGSSTKSVGKSNTSREGVRLEKPPAGLTREEFEAWKKAQMDKVRDMAKGELTGKRASGPVSSSTKSATTKATSNVSSSQKNEAKQIINNFKNNNPTGYDNLLDFLNNEVKNGVVAPVGGKQVVSRKGQSLAVKPYRVENVNDDSIMEMVLDSYFNNKEGLRNVAPEIVEQLDNAGFGNITVGGTLLTDLSYEDYLNQFNDVSEPKPIETNTTEKVAYDVESKGNKLSEEDRINVDNVFASYVPSKVKFKDAKEHPANIAESAAMAAVEMPDPTYKPIIPEKNIKSGYPSNVQLESIVYAGQAMEQKLPSGERKGFLIGDGTGVGKGIQIASIILDNFNHGRKKAIWISKSADLINDAKRDWKNLGMNPDNIISLNSYKINKPINLKEGIVFLTYNTLEMKGKESQKELTRVDQLVNWLGADSDCVVAFDESHKMGNSITTRGKMGAKKPSGMALAGIDLQKKLPNARILYASATAGTEVSNFGYLERLGLWGEGTAFANKEDFANSISAAGLGAMEVIARDLKAQGLYVARSISYDGVQYETLEHELTPIQKEIYNNMSKAWQIVFENMNKALQMTNQDLDGKKRGKVLGQFFSRQQNFFNQVLTAMSMPSVLTRINTELQNGRSVVIQLVDTNEAELNRQITKAKAKAIENSVTNADDISYEDVDLTPSEMLIRLVESAFPVEQYEEYVDEDGNTRSRPVLNPDGTPVLNREAVEARDELLMNLKEMRVPDGPLEMLMNEFGEDNVAEVTGRSKRIVEVKDENGNIKRELHSISKNAREAEIQAFQDGKKHILVFSKAGGTGKSFHADNNAKNKEQRVHILLQAGWESAEAMQGLGRTHRTNEASQPVYVLVTTNVLGQKRFLSTIARRLGQLGALTKGQRQANGGLFTEKDNLENPLSTSALAEFYKRTNNPAVFKKVGLYDKIYDQYGRVNEKSDALRDVPKFLNRILALEVDEQNEVFNEFFDIYGQMIEDAQKRGELDTGLENLKADKVEVIDNTVAYKAPNGVTTNYLQLNVYNKPKYRSYDTLPYIGENYQGIVRINNKEDANDPLNGHIRALYKVSSSTNAKGEIVDRYELKSPNKNVSNTWVGESVNAKTEKLPEEEWEKAWMQETKSLPEYNEEIKHMFTGALLPIWDKLPITKTKVQRVILEDGTQYLGRIVTQDQAKRTLQLLGVAQGMTEQKFENPKEIMNKILFGGQTATLSNRTKLVRRVVSGEPRIEINGLNIWQYAKTYPNIITEIIQSERRYFIPTGDKGEEIIKDMIKYNPVISLQKGNTEEFSKAKQQPKAPDVYPDEWTAERTKNNTAEAKPLLDIINDIKKQYGIHITTGYKHIRNQGVRGLYSHANNGVKTANYGDLPTTIHETIGHALDAKYGIRDKFSTLAQEELKKNLDPDFAAGYSDEQLLGEGWAEFMRKFMQNSDVAQIDYPQTMKELINILPDHEMAVLFNFADEINAYYSSGDTTYKEDIRSRRDGVPDARSLKEKLTDTLNLAYQKHNDRFHSLKRLDESQGTNTYKQARASAYVEAQINYTIMNEVYYHGNYIGPGFGKIISGYTSKVLEGYNDKKLKAKEKRNIEENFLSDVGEYLFVKHAPERLVNGKRNVRNDAKDNANRYAERAEVLAEIPYVKDCADAIRECWDNIIYYYGVQSGILSEKVYKDWKELYPNYVPFTRVYEEWELDSGSGKSAKGSFANQSPNVYRAKGSTRMIWDPIENLMNYTIKFVKAGVYNEVGANIAREMERVEGDASWMAKDPNQVVRRSIWTGKLKKRATDRINQLYQAGKIQSVKDLDIMLDEIDKLDEYLYQFEDAKPTGNEVYFMKNGEPEYWSVNDPQLLMSILSLKPKQSNEVVGFISNITRFMTNNITGVNIIWSASKNSAMDFLTALFFSPIHNPAKLAYGIAKSWINSIKYQTGKGEVDYFYREMLAMGGGENSLYSLDTNTTKYVIDRIMKRRVYNPFYYMGIIGNTIELGPRQAIYEYCRKELGYSPEEAIYAMKEGTVDFSRGGDISREVAKFVPFYNSSVQGIDRFLRWISAEDISQEKRSKVCKSRLFTFIGVSAMLGALQFFINSFNFKDWKFDDEKAENYAKLSNYTKNNFFCIPLLKDGKFLTIPKDRELTVPSSIIEALLTKYLSGDKNRTDELYDYITDNMLPNIWNNIAQLDLIGGLSQLGLVGVISQVVANKNFLGNPIVSNSLKYKAPALQYDGTTSKLAKKIGELLDWSPKMIDHFMSNTLGITWNTQKYLLPVDSENRDWSLGILSTWTKDNQYSTDVVNRLYEMADESSNEYSLNGTVASEYSSKMDSRMTDFYSTYSSAAKNNTDEESKRVAKECMLDLIQKYISNSETGSMTKAQQLVYDICEQSGSTMKSKSSSYLPSVMDNSIKDKNDNTITLTDSQYIDYQTSYWDEFDKLVESVIPNCKSLSEKQTAMGYIHTIAKERARNDELSNLGKSKTDYFDNYSGVSDAEVVLYKTKLSELKSGDNATNTEIAEAVLSLGLSSSKSDTLYKSSASNDDTSPWGEKYSGIKANNVVSYWKAIKKYNVGANNVTQDEAEQAIRSLGITDEHQNYLLWKTANKSWKDTNNPWYAYR